eukprot:TRINITY_DN2557_c1_g1_i1.p1 TRINITY_DN2557_c1_g1~~TRINITY_DN2557_c1_g1_i1.p1  ORF type:complete len:478 (+),score=114.56 TRINITY_DN2557_c1_g1_i1:74-1507(+)
MFRTSVVALLLLVFLCQPSTVVAGDEKNVLVKYSMNIDFKILIGKIEEIVTKTQQGLGGSGNARCINICTQTGGTVDDIGKCYTCAGTENQRSPLLLANEKLVITVAGTAPKSKVILVDDLDQLIRPIPANVGGELNIVTTTISTTSPTPPTPPTPPSPVGEKAVVVKYSIALDFDILVKNADQITTETQKSLGGTGTGMCTDICSQKSSTNLEDVDNCHTCSGVKQLRQVSALETSKLWVIAITGTAKQEDTDFSDDLKRIIGAIVTKAGGELRTITVLYSNTPNETPLTPQSTEAEKGVLVKYSMSFDFDTLVKSTSDIATATQKSLGGRGVGKCVNICAQTGDDIANVGECFSCSGVKQHQRATVLALDKWVVSISGTAPVSRDGFSTELMKAIRAVITPLGGELHTLTTSSTYIEGPSDSDDSISGGAIAGIVIGCVAGIVIVLLVVYFFCKSRESEDETEMEEPKNIPDSTV